MARNRETAGSSLQGRGLQRREASPAGGAWPESSRDEAKTGRQCDSWAAVGMLLERACLGREGVRAEGAHRG